MTQSWLILYYKICITSETNLDSHLIKRVMRSDEREIREKYKAEVPVQSSGNAIINLLTSFPLFTYVISFFKDVVISILKTGPIPKHVAIIMDGNRTFARKNKLDLKDGHLAGAESLVHVLDVCYRVGVEHVTIYAFSIENFNRSKTEVDTLFNLLRDKLKVLSNHDDSYARSNKVRVKIIGNRSMIPADILTDLENIELITNKPDCKKCLNVCFPYTGRDDITHSIQSVVQQRVENKISTGDIDLDSISHNTYFGPETPDLDMLIRTSGHTRLSDFMIWQCNYNSTIEFVDILWPDFKFLAIVTILLKWSYYKTLEMEASNHVSVAVKLKSSEINVLQELSPHPPYQSVTDRN